LLLVLYFRGQANGSCQKKDVSSDSSTCEKFLGHLKTEMF